MQLNFLNCGAGKGIYLSFFRQHDLDILTEVHKHLIGTS